MSNERETRYAEAVYDIAVDHPMWIDGNGAPLDYSPEREAHISGFVSEAARAVMAVADEERNEAGARSYQAAREHWKPKADAAEARLDALVADLRGLADEWRAGRLSRVLADDLRAVLDKHAGGDVQ
jgi:hypothetical protein